MSFELDTSGFIGWWEPGDPRLCTVCWDDLSPFDQGYIEAMMAQVEACRAAQDTRPTSLPYGFSDLAPEALDRIREDCRRFLASTKTTDSRAQGDRFWQARQIGAHLDFPPQTASLGDDGKVYLRDAA